MAQFALVLLLAVEYLGFVKPSLQLQYVIETYDHVWGQEWPVAGTIPVQTMKAYKGSRSITPHLTYSCPSIKKEFAQQNQ